MSKARWPSRFFFGGGWLVLFSVTGCGGSKVEPAGAAVAAKVEGWQEGSEQEETARAGNRSLFVDAAPASDQLSIVRPVGLADCSAVLIGPRVLVTAGHCVEGPSGTNGIGPTVKIELDSQEGTCEAAGVGYSLPDLAFCRLDGPVFNWRKFETAVLTTEPAWAPAVGSKLRGVGWGLPTSGSTYSHLGQAMVKVEAVSEPCLYGKADSDPQGGDSGGAVLYEKSASRRLVAVVATMNSATPMGQFCMTNLSGTMAKKFFADWVGRHAPHGGVCGHDLLAGSGDCMP
jgi:Trypsin